MEWLWVTNVHIVYCDVASALIAIVENGVERGVHQECMSGFCSDVYYTLCSVGSEVRQSDDMAGKAACNSLNSYAHPNSIA